MIVESEGHYDSSLRGNELPLSVSSGLVEITSLATHYVYYFHCFTMFLIIFFVVLEVCNVS